MNTAFACKRCGFCCHGETTVSLNREDQLRMLDHLQLSHQEALQKYWRCTDGIIQMKTVKGACVFYEDGCTLHKARPWRCREWPLTRAILVSKDNLDILKESCPGIRQDVTYEEMCRAIEDLRVQQF
jgi:uncharacterized protein